MYQNLLARLLHWANTDPPPARTRFYALKERLLNRYGTFRGHDTQEVTKPCYGDGWWRDDGGTPCGPACRRCGGTGVFDRRWVRLERYEWKGFVFHRPSGDTRKRPESVQIVGRIEHADYGRLSREAALWLYLLSGEGRLFLREMSGGWACGWYAWPLCNLQRVATKAAMKFRWRRCWCGRAYPTWGTGWQVCRRCRREPADLEVPF